jgi:hypothetical protein
VHPEHRANGLPPPVGRADQVEQAILFAAGVAPPCRLDADLAAERDGVDRYRRQPVGPRIVDAQPECHLGDGGATDRLRFCDLKQQVRN